MFLDLGRFNIHCAATSMVLCGCFRLISGGVSGFNGISGISEFNGLVNSAGSV